MTVIVSATAAIPGKIGGAGIKACRFMLRTVSTYKGQTTKERHPAGRRAPGVLLQKFVCDDDQEKGRQCVYIVRCRFGLSFAIPFGREA